MTTSASSGTPGAGPPGQTTVPPGSIRLTELFRFPLKHKIFPDAQRLMADARGWLLPYVIPLGGAERVRYIIDETLSMCAYLYPEADYEGILLATSFLTLEFVNDDLLDGADVYEALQASGEAGRHTADDLRRIRSNPRILVEGILGGVSLLRNPSVDPRSFSFPDGISGRMFLHEAIHDLSVRLHDFGQRRGGPHFGSWIEGFCDALIRFGTSHRRVYTKMDAVTVEEYTEHKFVNSGMLHTVELLDLAMGTFLSPDQYKHPVIAGLRDRCCRIGSLLNEIASYEKEVFRENATNLLLVMMRKLDIDLEAATRRVAALVDRYAEDVVQLVKQAQKDFDGDDEDSRTLRRYVHGLELIAAACWYWQVEGTLRYKSSTSPFAELLLEPR